MGIVEAAAWLAACALVHGGLTLALNRDATRQGNRQGD